MLHMAHYENTCIDVARIINSQLFSLTHVEADPHGVLSLSRSADCVARRHREPTP